jgi:AraC family transcriptional regulator
MDGWAYLRDTYFPEHGLRHAGTPDFEAYAEGDMSAPDYRMELWVPVEKAADS